jgi:hypothetical protein
MASANDRNGLARERDEAAQGGMIERILSLALMALTVPASASDDAAGRVAVAASFADLRAVVRALGHEVEAEDPSNQSLRAVAHDGTRYVLTGTACDIEGVPGCRGVVMQVLFDATETVTLERLAAANLSQVAVSTRYDPRTTVISVTRYVVADGGVTMANVAANIEVLLALAPEVLGILFADQGGTIRPE